VGPPPADISDGRRCHWSIGAPRGVVRETDGHRRACRRARDRPAARRPTRAGMMCFGFVQTRASIKKKTVIEPSGRDRRPEAKKGPCRTRYRYRAHGPRFRGRRSTAQTATNASNSRKTRRTNRVGMLLHSRQRSPRETRSASGLDGSRSCSYRQKTVDASRHEGTSTRRQIITFRYGAAGRGRTSSANIPPRVCSGDASAHTYHGDVGVVVLVCCKTGVQKTGNGYKRVQLWRAGGQKTPDPPSKAAFQRFRLLLYQLVDRSDALRFDGRTPSSSEVPQRRRARLQGGSRLPAGRMWVRLD